jgi:hypothetical protein
VATQPFVKLSKRTGKQHTKYDCEWKTTRDVIIDLREKMRDWKAMKPVKPGALGVSGFIQELSVEPFYTTFYLQEQVDPYIQSCGKAMRRNCFY